jgi:hypothetical protein
MRRRNRGASPARASEPPAGGGERCRPADYPELADWKYKNLSHDRWNGVYEQLKEKFQHSRLTDPFEKYLHDTYFPRREKASKKNPAASNSAKSRKAQQVILLIFAISWMVL